MTFVSVAQAARRLGIDVKPLRRWLAEAQLPLHRHAQDGRKKGVSSEHLHTLARLHQRSLTPLPQESSALVPTGESELSAALLALPERLNALETQLTALQQQVAALTALLQFPVPEPAQPAPSTKPRRPPSKPASPAPRSRSLTKPPAKPAHVIPRVEYGAEGHYVVICPKAGVLPFEPESPAWFAWLAEQSSFRFVGKCGHLTAHHEWRVPQGAWRAHRHLRNHSYTLRLAPTQELTIAVLEQAAEALQAHLT
jgi:hypothetical protein